jgi:hypothetical protein
MRLEDQHCVIVGEGDFAGSDACYVPHPVKDLAGFQHNRPRRRGLLENRDGPFGRNHDAGKPRDDPDWLLSLRRC